MFFLTLQGKEPIHEQIRQQIQRFVALGALEPGEKLPSVRQLAQESGINPNTVARAYQRLEEEGVIFTLPKKGAYVAKNQTEDEEAQLRAAIENLRRRGVKREKLLALLDEVYKEE